MKKRKLLTKIGGNSIAFFSYLFLYIPIIILITFSFNAKSFPSSWDHFTLHWYHELFNSKEIWSSFFNSCIIALSSTFLSLSMGVLLIFFKANGGKIQKALPLFYGNLIIPETVLVISLLSYFSLFKIELGMTTLIVSHTVLGLGFSIPIIYSRFLQLDPRLSEASLGLGASPFQTFFRITLPLLRSTLIATGLLISIISFDDFILSYFCAGTSVTTLSLFLISMLRLGISPIVNALSTILLVLSCVLVMFFFSPKIRSRIL